MSQARAPLLNTPSAEAEKRYEPPSLQLSIETVRQFVSYFFESERPLRSECESVISRAGGNQEKLQFTFERNFCWRLQFYDYFSIMGDKKSVVFTIQHGVQIICRKLVKVDLPLSDMGICQQLSEILSAR